MVTVHLLHGAIAALAVDGYPAEVDFRLKVTVSSTSV